MSRKATLSILLVLILAAPMAYAADCCSEEVRAPAKQSGPLFNGKDLSGWATMWGGKWEARDGHLFAVPGSGMGWLRTEKQYKDFVLQLEYKLTTAEGNSGVALRSTTEGDPAFSGMEVQIHDDYGKPVEKHISGSIYDAIAPSVNAVKPLGKWNKLKISLIGNKIDVWENGKHIIDADLADPEINAGLTENRKFANRAKVGYIALQNYDMPAEFRNIRIREM